MGGKPLSSITPVTLHGGKRCIADEARLADPGRQTNRSRAGLNNPACHPVALWPQARRTCGGRSCDTRSTDPPHWAFSTMDAPANASGHTQIDDKFTKPPKTPYSFELANGNPIGFAELWDAWKDNRATGSRASPSLPPRPTNS